MMPKKRLEDIDPEERARVVEGRKKIAEEKRKARNKSEREKEYHKNYYKEHGYRQCTILNKDSDRDVIEQINKQQNKTDYIRQLVRADIASGGTIKTSAMRKENPYNKAENKEKAITYLTALKNSIKGKYDAEEEIEAALDMAIEALHN